MSWEHVLYIAGGTTVIAVTFQKVVWPTIKGILTFARTVQDVAVALPGLLELATVAEIIVEIALQFQPNEGSSLRDQVDRINQGLDTLTGQVEQALILDPGTRTRSDD